MSNKAEGEGGLDVLFVRMSRGKSSASCCTVSVDDYKQTYLRVILTLKIPTPTRTGYITQAPPAKHTTTYYYFPCIVVKSERKNWDVNVRGIHCLRVHRGL